MILTDIKKGNKNIFKTLEEEIKGNIIQSNKKILKIKKKCLTLAKYFDIINT